MKKSILYIEDDKINAMVLRKFLESEFEVEIAYDAESGIEKCSKRIYDIVLMDIHLGKEKMSGIEAMQLLKKMDTYQEIPIIAFTAYALPEDRNYYLELGFSEYISKPADRIKILTMLESFID